jgi:hypothetical protein
MLSLTISCRREISFNEKISGKWFYDEKTNEFFLDGNAGQEDDSYWRVSLNDDSMYWKGRKFEFNKRFEIFFKKAG